jgi:hypothetical protein
MRQIAWLVFCCACGSRADPHEPVSREPVRQGAMASEPLQQIAASPTEPTGSAASCGPGWRLELLPPEPPVEIDQVRVRPGGAWRVMAIAGPVPNAPAKHFDRPITEDWSAVDSDGTVVFTGHWYGNPDQTNNVGVGIYQLAGDRAVPLVDSFTVMPDIGQRFNEVGLPNIEDGKVAFYADRDGGHLGGVYLYHDGKITPIAGPRDTVRGTGTPSMRGGAIAFQGEQGGVAGVYLWTPQRGVARAFQIGDLGITLLFSVALGDGVVFAGAGLSLEDHREIVAWSGGAPRVIAAGDDFRDGNGAVMYLAPEPVAHRTHVAFTVGIEHYTEAWVADARADATCKRERVAATGDALGTSRIAMVSGLSRDAFTADGRLLLTVVLDNQQVRLVRATRRRSW